MIRKKYNPNMKSKESIIIKIAYLSELRSKLPSGYIYANSVVQMEDSGSGEWTDGKRHHLSLNSERGRRVAKGIRLRMDIDRRIKELESYWRTNYKGKIPDKKDFTVKVASPCGMNGAFFRRAKQESNDMAHRSSFVYKGVCYRSKNEVIVAEILDELGLEFKYEPKVVLDNGQIVYPDFLVNIAEADRCFIIEIQGMMNDAKYLTNAIQKESAYFQHGFRDGKEILFFKSGTDSMDFDAFRLLVEAVTEANIKEAFKIS